MSRPRSRTEIRREFRRLRRALIALERRIDASLKQTYRELGWSRIHGRRRPTP